MSSDRLHAPLNSLSSEPSPLVEARFIPRQYEPNYPYPLLVHFHARGGDEDQLVRAMPALSWRNYVGLGLRGPEPVTKRDRLVGFGWGAEFEQPGRRRVARARVHFRSRGRFAGRFPAPSQSRSNVWKRLSSSRSCKPGGCCTRIPSASSWSVAARGPRWRTGWDFPYPERFAGVVAINGWLPVGLRPLCQAEGVPQLLRAGRPRRLEQQGSAGRRSAERGHAPGGRPAGCIPVVSQRPSALQRDALGRGYLADGPVHRRPDPERLIEARSPGRVETSRGTIPRSWFFTSRRISAVRPPKRLALKVFWK